MNLEFEYATAWLDRHQICAPTVPSASFADISHPSYDGDGFATRVFRIVHRIVPLILEGKVVRLFGGFRGYTDAEEGFTSLFKPFCRETEEGGEEWEEFPPKELRQKPTDWWIGVVAFYFLRPLEETEKRTEELEPSEEFVGVHLRYGDNYFGRQISISRYSELVDSLECKNKYVATDSSEALAHFQKLYPDISAQTNALSLDMSRPGTSAAWFLVRNEKEKWVLRVAREVLIDILVLSKAKFLIGLSVSKITTLAKLIGNARGNIQQVFEL
jgi:hypothetical protein